MQINGVTFFFALETHEGENFALEMVWWALALICEGEENLLLVVNDIVFCSNHKNNLNDSTTSI